MQRRAERFFLGVGRYTPNSALEGELGWKTPEHRHWISVFRLWFRLRDMDRNRINHHVFAWSLNCTRAGLKNWGSRVKGMLVKLDMLHIFDVNSELNSKGCIKDLDNVLQEFYFRNWHNSVNNNISKSGKGGNKLRTYALFKDNCTAEPYVSQVMNKQSRGALAKFRCGVAPLKIELGRYSSLK